MNPNHKVNMKLAKIDEENYVRAIDVLNHLKTTRVSLEGNMAITRVLDSMIIFYDDVRRRRV